ncbi:MAG TPA: coniferyl aldehyde dehydrogenase [Pseudonocardiaceae bacterium]
MTAISTLEDLLVGLRAQFDVQRAAVHAHPMPSADERVDRINRLIAIMTGDAREIVDAIVADYGSRSHVQSIMTEVLGPLPSITHTRRHVASWMKPRRAWAGPLGLLGGRASVEWQPLGVVGIISTWNFPVGTTFVPAAQAFAAGNHVMLKLSEDVPNTAAVLRSAIAREFDPAELVAVTGGPEVGEAFASLPFDHLLLTGSTATGRLVQRAAAVNLTPVTLELGGRCPVVVGSGADMSKVADRIMAGKTINSGQLCFAPNHVYVREGRERDFVAAVRASVRRMYPTMLDNDDYTSIINERHYQRLMGYLEEAQAKGAEIIEINPAGEDFTDQPAHKIPVMLVLGADPSMSVLREELFGPVLPVLTYGELREPIEEINRGDKPLAAYWFGSDPAERRLFLDRTSSGGVTLDDVILHYTVDDIPFGGVGASGTGAYHGRWGFERFSHARSILRAPRRFSANSLMAAPFGQRFRKITDWLVRHEARVVGKRLARDEARREAAKQRR